MEFSEIFSRLRREKNISQRKAASDLKISQALLSHYENGLREPRFEFVIRACEYYNVSADYLLGRTTAKENPMITGMGFNEDGDESDLVRILESKNMYSLINAITVMMSLMVNVYNEKVVEKACDYFSVVAYNLFRYMGIYGDKMLSDALQIPEYKFNIMCDSAAKMLEADIADAAHSNEFGALDQDCLQRFRNKFPSACKSFQKWLLDADSEISKIFNEGRVSDDTAR